MLVLSRRTDEKIVIGRNITVTVLRIQGRIVKIGVEAPDEVAVLRSELLGRPSPRERGEPRLPGDGPDDEPSASDDAPSGPVSPTSCAPQPEGLPKPRRFRKSSPSACLSFAP
jgi:carbon storage regulator CsrA